MQVNRKLLLAGMIILAGMRLRAQTEADVVTYINTFKGIAITEMQRSGVPAAITLAQGIHESQAGTSDLVKRSNNHFGIKCKDEWTGERVYHDDDARGECFRSYPNPADSYRDHSDFLKNRPYYAALFTLDPADYEGWSNGLRKAGYATNPKYAQILIKLIQDYQLEQYSLIGLGRTNVKDEVVLTSPGAFSAPLTDAVFANGGVPGFGGAVPSGDGRGAVAGSGQTAGGQKQIDMGTGPANTGGSPSGAGRGPSGNGGIAVAGTAKVERVHPDAGAYPQGEFMINRARVIYAKGGTSMLAIANQYGVSLSKLLEFNDLEDQDVLEEDQLVFLQRKRKVGGSVFHIVREGETLYDICQSEGVRYQELMDMNHLGAGNEPATGEKIYLQGRSPSRPLVVN